MQPHKIRRIRVFSTKFFFEYQGAHRMRASLQHVEQKLFLSFFDYMGKKTPRGWAVLVQAVLRASPARARMAQPLGVFLPLQSKKFKSNLFCFTCCKEALMRCAPLDSIFENTPIFLYHFLS